MLGERVKNILGSLVVGVITFWVVGIFVGFLLLEQASTIPGFCFLVNAVPFFVGGGACALWSQSRIGNVLVYATLMAAWSSLGFGQEPRGCWVMIYDAWPLSIADWQIAGPVMFFLLSMAGGMSVRFFIGNHPA